MEDYECPWDCGPCEGCQSENEVYKTVRGNLCKKCRNKMFRGKVERNIYGIEEVCVECGVGHTVTQYLYGCIGSAKFHSIAFDRMTEKIKTKARSRMCDFDGCESKDNTHCCLECDKFWCDKHYKDRSVMIDPDAISLQCVKYKEGSDERHHIGKIW